MKTDDLDKLTLTPTAPRRLGKYVLLGRLGHGGMGKIYLAFLPGPADIEKLLVIKRLHGHLTEDKALVESFLDEAKLSMAINHPNVVHTFDVGELDKRFFMVMEYVEGQNLGVLLRTAKRSNHYPSSPIWAGLFIEVLDGLHAAHIATDARGRPFNIIHRDVSPQNIIVGYDGIPKLVDFGIAKAAMRINQTDAGVLKGKCAYMSPEQCQTNELDPRSDIFSAGIVLWEMLAGRRLYKSDNVLRSVERIVKEAPVPPSDINTEADPQFNAVVVKALQKNPDDRFQTAEDFRDALDECLVNARFHYKKSAIREMMSVCFSTVIERQRTILDSCLEAHHNFSQLPTESENELSLRGEELAEDGESHGTGRSERFQSIQEEGETTTPSSSALNPLMTAENEAEMLPGGIKTVPQRRGLSSKKKMDFGEVIEIDANTQTASHLHHDMQEQEPQPKRKLAAGLYLTVISAVLIICGFALYPKILEFTAPPLPQTGTATVPTGQETSPGESLPPKQDSSSSTQDSTRKAQDAPEQKQEEKQEEKQEPTVAETSKAQPAKDATIKSQNAKQRKNRRRPSSSQSTSIKKKAGPQKGATNTQETQTDRQPIQPPQKLVTEEQTGFLTLDTSPWTNVYLNEKKLGETPINRLKVPAGKIKLVLKNSAEGIEQEYWVTIKPGELTRKRLGLK